MPYKLFVIDISILDYQIGDGLGTETLQWDWNQHECTGKMFRYKILYGVSIFNSACIYRINIYNAYSGVLLCIEHWTKYWEIYWDRDQSWSSRVQHLVKVIRQRRDDKKSQVLTAIRKA